MIINEIQIENFCQHEDLHLNFPSSGVIIIQGPNGCGKSNLVRALQFGLTGTVSNTSSKDLNLKWGKSTGSVLINFTYGNQEGRLTRSLTSSKAVLNYAGETLRTVSSVNNKLEALLGNLKLFDKFIIVQQGRLTELLDVPTAERMKLLHLLFRTDKYEKIYNAINVELNNYLNIYKPIEEPDEIRTKLTELLTSTMQLGVDLENCKTKVKAIDGPSLTKELGEMSAMRTRTSSLSLVQQQHNQVMTSIAATTAEIRRLEAELATQKPPGNIQEADYLQAFMTIKDMEAELSRFTAKEKVAQLQQSLEAEATWLKDNKPKVPEASQEAIDTATKELAEVEASIKHYESYIKGFEHGECPTCRTTVVIKGDGSKQDIGANLSSYRGLVDRAKQRSNEITQYCRQLRESVKKYNADLQLYQLRYKGWTANVDNLNREVEALKPTTYATREEVNAAISTANQLIAAYSKYKAVEQQANTNIQTLKTQLSTYEKTAAALTDRLGQLQADVKILEAYDFQSATAKLNEWNQLNSRITTLEANIAHAQVQITEHTSRLDKVIAMLNKANAQLMYKELLSKAKDILHRDSLPTAIARAHLSTLNSEWNMALQDLDVPFTVELNNNLDITVNFAENKAMSNQLSGGQQCCLSLAFLLAVKKHFATSTNFMVLDEPTYGLDDEHISRLIEVLMTIDQYAQSNNIQVFVVTHEARIKENFKQVITLDVT